MALSLGVRSCAAGLLLAALGTPPGAGAQPTPVGSEFQVNSYTTSTQYNPSVAAHADGDFVVVWESFGSSGSDSDDFSIQGQRYRSPNPVPSLSPSALASLALLMLLAFYVALRRRA
jgi:hypothetical protein